MRIHCKVRDVDSTVELDEYYTHVDGEPIQDLKDRGKTAEQVAQSVIEGFNSSLRRGEVARVLISGSAEFVNDDIKHWDQIDANTDYGDEDSDVEEFDEEDKEDDEL